MIESIQIEDLGVIESAEITLSPGLTALTGETGAGKTMVLTSLGLLLGQRAESSVVRHGASRAVVEGVILTAPDSRAAQRAAEAGAVMDDDVLIVSRTVPASGRSRAHLGGRAVPSAVLAEVGGFLVSVHGQADQLRLRSAAAQRAALDSVGGPEHAALCRAYAQAYRQWVRAGEQLRAWREGAAQRQAEVTRLREWLARLEELDPQPGEDRELTAEAARLDRAEDLRLAAGRARAALVGEEEGTGLAQDADVASLLAQGLRELEAVADVDAHLAELAGRLERVAIETSDVADELGEYLAGLSADPARLAWVQQRRGDLARACREIGTEEITDVDALLDFGRRAASRLAELDGPTDVGQERAQALEQARVELASCATRLTQARQRLAAEMSERVTEELAGLEMRGAQIQVRLDPLDEPGPTGAESVAILLVSHPGAPALPLGKGASGGELSRIMLALELVLAQARDGQDPAEADAARKTLVFDEIDAGVGGRAASEIGRRLARLARTHQVIVVTHLAQVAAWADRQLVVRKHVALPADGAHDDPQDAEGQVTAATRTRVVPVTGEERLRELARMLSGHDDSHTAVQHAAELLEEARVAQSTL